jgi:hypothetical protein
LIINTLSQCATAARIVARRFGREKSIDKRFLGPVAKTASAALVWSEYFGHNTLHIHALPPANPFPLWGAQSIYAGTSTGTGTGVTFKTPGVSQ